MRQIIGYALIAAPFVGVITFGLLMIGLRATLVVWALILLIAMCFVGGAYMVGGPS